MSVKYEKYESISPVVATTSQSPSSKRGGCGHWGARGTCEDNVDDDDDDTVEANQQTKQSKHERRKKSCSNKLVFRIKGS